MDVLPLYTLFQCQVNNGTETTLTVSTTCTTVTPIKLEEPSVQSLMSWRLTSGPGMQQPTLAMNQMRMGPTATVIEVVRAKQTCMIWTMKPTAQGKATKLTHSDLSMRGLTSTRKMDSFRDIRLY